MALTRDQTSLREPGFLLWLGQFVGEWMLEGKVEVDRRDDGFLEAFSVDSGMKVSLGKVLRSGEFLGPAKSPLGNYPVVLSSALMNHWLTSEDLSNLREAWHVGAGIARILETIEKRIVKLPQPERDRRWLAWWESGAASLRPLSDRDSAAHRMLYLRCR